MAYDDTKWGGFAKIIVDTSTMTVGDTVRVKSITTGTNYDKQVVTVGTPLIWETDIYKDYVKICMVQTINDTPTEVGGDYRECDYGQTLFINILDKTTLGGIQGILNAHKEGSLLDIGDEVDITVNGSPWTMQVAGVDIYDTHEVILVSKFVWTLARVGTASRASYTSSDQLKASMESFYSGMTETDKALIKNTTKYSARNDTSGWDSFTAKVFPLNYKEITGLTLPAQSSAPNTQIQMPLFATQSNRIKLYNGTAYTWFSCDGGWGSTDAWAGITDTGAGGTQISKSTAYGAVPAFRLTADS